MSVLITVVREGAYADSIVLMQLQSDLQRLDGVLSAGVVMGAAVNLDLLRASDLLDSSGRRAQADDLVIAIRASSKEQATAAIGQIDTLMRNRKTTEAGDYRPRSLATGLRLLPEASWVSVSIPGRYAATIADEALEHDRHVFLYSDNVGRSDEIELKRKAAARGLLMMGPDCGSAIIGGIGFGFSNGVRRGPIGLVCASGTGLQAIASRIHHLGSGISQAIGTGGRDLSSFVEGATARQGLDLLARDPATQIIVVTSKPPDIEVGREVMAQASAIDKPVVVLFSGSVNPGRQLGNLHFARTLTEAAELAVSLAQQEAGQEVTRRDVDAERRYLRGLFVGGTLAFEAVQTAIPLLAPLYTNLVSEHVSSLPESTRSVAHTILDLGADEYTVGRLHPMMDQRLRLERLEKEAADPQTDTIVLDVVLGRGAQPDPAGELAPILHQITAASQVRVVALIVGTDEDPQNLESTIERLADAGATVFTDVSRGLAHAVGSCVAPSTPLPEQPVDLSSLQPPGAVINVGLETLHQDFADQGLETIQVDWRPPAGGNERLMAILEKMKT